ncbi:hypothetical protein [Leuconostoc gasicomitatum]|nr:hypothetical protein [Leuconostoc gasicomitatum]
MSLSLQMTIFDHDNLQIKGTFPVLVYDLQMDAISNISSTFVIVKQDKLATGDYVAIRPTDETAILYYGQTTTLDSNDASGIMTLTTNYIWNVFNGDVVIKSYSGDSYEWHIASMVTQYFGAKKILNSVSHSTATQFEISNSDGISVQNFIDYLIRGFKLRNVVIDVKGIDQGMSNGIPFYYPKIDIHQNTETWNFKNDVYTFTDWSVSDSRMLRGYANELWLVDKESTNMEKPTVLAKYWLKKDGSVVKKLDDDVLQPTQLKMYLFDKKATDNPTYDSIASTNLAGNGYNHNIQFSMPVDNNFLPFEKLKLGLQSNIYYNQKVYKSVLTSYSITSDKELVRLTFGNLRFGRKDFIGRD